MKKVQFIGVVLIGLSVILLGNNAAIGLRCGVRLISVGDPKSKVLHYCGDPAYVEAWEEERIYKYHYKPSHNYGHENDYLEPRYVKYHVIVEEWTYNHGRHRFMDYVRFENGRVRKIISGDYGY